MIIWADSFDNYNALAEYWSSSGSSSTIQLNTGNARTGIGCLQLTGFGPVRNIGHVTHLLGVTNWHSDAYGAVMAFNNTDADVGFNSQIIAVNVVPDGNIQIFRHPAGGGGEIARTAIPNLVKLNSYVNIACEVTYSATNGIVKVWVNGMLVIDLAGQNTAFPGRPDVTNYNAIQLMAPGGLPTTFHDDCYFADCSTGPNVTFLGALRLYSLPPTANAGVSWTPLTGQNWSEVNEVPPDGDTSYNSSGTPGQQDQYLYPNNVIPPNSFIPFLYHSLDLKTDGEARSVASVVEGSVNAASIGLTADYFIYPAFYDLNPSTGNPFDLTEFPLTAGPKLTA